MGVCNSIVPVLSALIDSPSSPLIGWGVIGLSNLKSDNRGEMWHVAPVSMMKGSEVREQLAEKEVGKLEDMEKALEKGVEGRVSENVKKEWFAKSM